MILYQRDYFLNRKSFEITSTGLQIKERTILSKREYFLEFDYVGSRMIKNKTGIKYWLVISLLAFAISIVFFLDNMLTKEGDIYTFLFYFIGGVACFVLYLVSLKQTILLVKPGNPLGIEFQYNKPNKNEFESFINQLLETRNKALLEKKGPIIENLSFDHNYSNQLWLLNNEVITQNDFNSVVNKLESVYRKPKKISGFRNSSDKN